MDAGNGGKKAFVKANNPVIRNQDDLRNEITNQLQFNRLLEEESRCEPVTEEKAKSIMRTTGAFSY